MLDHRSIVYCIISNMVTLFGFITLNSIAIVIGILAGISTVVYNIVNTWIKIKESKKDVDRIK